jgi:hypothetical protein
LLLLQRLLLLLLLLLLLALLLQVRPGDGWASSKEAWPWRCQCINVDTLLLCGGILQGRLVGMVCPVQATLDTPWRNKILCPHLHR